MGLPAMSVPCGFANAGLPTGFEVYGRPFDENDCAPNRGCLPEGQQNGIEHRLHERDKLKPLPDKRRLHESALPVPRVAPMRMATRPM